jgi:phenylalanyl-tRNA synthetase beta chain
MKIPYSIIKKFIPELNKSPEELLDLITLKSYEVDSVYNPGDALKNIVVGHIQKITPHPNADKLNIAEVLVDNNEVLTIVCGAKNIELGQKVAVAKIGATLPNGLSIQMVNLRGQDSFGMICSAQELGFNSKSEGILILPANANIGDSIAEALNLEEAIIDIDNKGLGTRASDSSSFYGVAREVALITNNKLEAIELSDIPVKKKLKKNIHIKTNLCKYYSLLEVSGLSNYKFDSNILSKGGYRVDLYVQTDVFKLDSEIHKTLDIINQKSQYPAVDLGNYVLFELGQPLHIFDAEKVKGKDIIIREAKKGEIFEDLNGNNIILEAGDIVICDSENIIALAGIIGGKSTAVGDGTTQVLIESAHFDHNRIRQTARRLKLLTEAAKRFERQIPVELVDIAIKRIIHIVEKSGLQALGYISKGHNTSNYKAVSLDYNYVRGYIGVDISDANIDKILKSLQIEMHRPLGSHKHNLIAPYWRVDLNTPEEYIEEIARLYGYNNITPNLDIDTIKPKSDPLFNFKRYISEELSKMQYIEILTYPYSKEGVLELINPVDESKPYLRQNLTQSMMDAISKNINFSQKLKFFELSNVFTSDQHLHLSMSNCDKSQDDNANINQTYNDFLRLIYQLGFDYTKINTEIIENKIVIKYIDNIVGIINNSIVIEVDLDTLYNVLVPIKETYNPIPKYPSVKRDITITVDKLKSANEVYKIIQSLVSVRCQYIGLKDKFENNNLINYTFHLEFRDSEKSLSDEEVNVEIDTIQKHFQIGQ